MNNKVTIYLDFDGTCVEHKYPGVGEIAPHFLEVMTRIQLKGVPVILNTMRSEFEEKALSEALHFLVMRGISNNRVTEKKIDPQPWDPPFENDIFIDNIALGIPMCVSPSKKSFIVDWKKVG